MKNQKIIPPPLPRCCFRTNFDYFIGRASPSLTQMFFMGADESQAAELAKYNLKLVQYKIEYLREKINKRTCTKAEYRAFVLLTR